MRTIATALALAGLMAAAAQAELVTERWGRSGRCRHAGAATFQPVPDNGVVVRFDLAALPEGAAIHRARLLIRRFRPVVKNAFMGLAGRDRLLTEGGRLPEPALIRPLTKAYPGRGQPVVRDEPLALLGPRFKSFDATDVVRRWAGGKLPNHGLWLNDALGWGIDRVHLEISYDGPLKDPPPPVTELKAFHRAGQVFLTWKEVNCPFAGRKDVTWGELKRLKDRVAAGKAPQVCYRIYRHTRPLAAGNLHQATLLDEVGQFSAFDERMIKRKWMGEQIKSIRLPDATVPRVVVRPEAVLPVGTGVYVRTSDRAGRFHYAVVSAIDGVENSRGLNAGNSLPRPLLERVARPEPVLHHTVPAKYAKGFLRRCYLLWTDPPLSNVPGFWHLNVMSPPARPARLVPLSLHAFWWSSGWGEGAGAWRARGDAVCLLMETPWILHKGIHEGTGTYKALTQGIVQDYWVRRLRNVLPWVRRQFSVDPDRMYVTSSDWAWHHGDLFAAVRENLTMDPKRSPTAIKGSRYWGSPARPAKTEWGISAWDYYDIAWYVRQHPKMELPFIYYTPNMHEGDFGRIDKPRFYRAMLDTRRAFLASWGARIDAGWIYQLKRSDPLAAFSNCSLDSDPGIGMGDGDPDGQINGYLRFDPSTAVDSPDRWEMDVWLAGPDARGRGGAPAEACTVDITPRRCRAFKPACGQKFKWTNTLLPARAPAPPQKPRKPKPPEAKPQAPGPPLTQTGPADADEHGLVTAKKVIVTKGRHRIIIRRHTR